MTRCDTYLWQFLALAAASAGGIGLTHAQAPAYPAKPIRMVIALAPGGGVDTTSRIMGQKLSELWGQDFLASYQRS